MQWASDTSYDSSPFSRHRQRFIEPFAIAKKDRDPIVGNNVNVIACNLQQRGYPPSPPRIEASTSTGQIY